MEGFLHNSLVSGLIKNDKFLFTNLCRRFYMVSCFFFCLNQVKKRVALLYLTISTLTGNNARNHSGHWKGIKELFESEKYICYLSSISKFHHCLVNNIKIIYMQCPDTTLVVRFNKWKTSVITRWKRASMILPLWFHTLQKENRGNIVWLEHLGTHLRCVWQGSHREKGNLNPYNPLGQGVRYEPDGRKVNTRVGLQLVREGATLSGFHWGAAPFRSSPIEFELIVEMWLLFLSEQ